MVRQSKCEYVSAWVAPICHQKLLRHFPENAPNIHETCCLLWFRKMSAMSSISLPSSVHNDKVAILMSWILHCFKFPTPLQLNFFQRGRVYLSIIFSFRETANRRVRSLTYLTSLAFTHKEALGTQSHVLAREHHFHVRWATGLH